MCEVAITRAPPTVFQNTGGNDVLITSCSHECTQSFEAADAQHQKRRHQVPKRDVFHEARKTHANHTSTRSFSPISLGRAGGSKISPHNSTLRGHATAYKVRSVEHVQGRQGKTCKQTRVFVREKSLRNVVQRVIPKEC